MKNLVDEEEEEGDWFELVLLTFFYSDWLLRKNETKTRLIFFPSRLQPWVKNYRLVWRKKLEILFFFFWFEEKKTRDRFLSETWLRSQVKLYDSKNFKKTSFNVLLKKRQNPLILTQLEKQKKMNTHSILFKDAINVTLTFN